MARYGKGTAINITKVTESNQLTAINDNFKKIQQQLMGVKDYIEPMAKAGQEIHERMTRFLGPLPPVSVDQMETYAQKRINMGPEPPEEPIEGEVWFVTDENGEVIAIRHWDGTQWIDDVDNVAVQQAIDEANQAAANAQQVGEQAQQTAEQATQVAQAAQAAADAATQAANDAQADADEAITQAQSAVDTANQATQDATNAINQAQSAFDNAQDALTTANNAIDTANNASQAASDAATQAQSALTQAQSAFDNAQNALQIANDTQNALGTKVDTAQYQTDLQNLQSDIAEKADVTWVNGQLVLKEDAIVKSNTAPTSPKNGQVWLDTSVSPAIVKYWDSTNEQWVKATPTEAGEVGAYTITEVDNALNGKVSVTTYQTDMNNVVTRLDNAESSIQQNADSIALKVDKTTYDADINDETNGLKTRMSNAETAITQNTNAIELKASQTDLDALNDTVTDINTSVSQLTVNVDDITTRVTTNEGDISSLQQTATSLTTRIGDAENNISTLQQTSDSFATRISNAEGNISSLTQTVSGLQTSVSDVQGDVSTLTQTADALQTRMTDAEGNISTLTQTTDSLTSQISTKADQSWVSSQISQLSDDINLRVSKDDIINQINLSTEGVLIDGAKVHITGQTTIDDAVITDAMIASLSASKLTAGTIDASVITVKNINASNIITGTLDASKVTVTNIDASKINTGTLNAARIAAGSIDASKLNVTSLSAISANLGNITAGNITGVTMNLAGGKFVVDADGNVTFGGTLSGATGTFSGTISSATILTEEYGNGYHKYSKIDKEGINQTYESLDSSGNILNTIRTYVAPANISMDFDDQNGFTQKRGALDYQSLLFTHPDLDPISSVGILLDDTDTLNIYNDFTKRIDFRDNTLFSVNALHFTDPGGAEGIVWDGGNGWKIVESPDDLSNAAGNLQIAKGSTRAFTVTTGLNVYFGGTSITNGGDFLEVKNPAHGARILLTSDSTSAFLLSEVVYNRTYPYAANMFVSSTGVIGRSTSATKYKLDITDDVIENPYAILNLKPKKWFDKPSIETYAALKNREMNGETIDWEKEYDIYLGEIHGLVAEDVEALGFSQYLQYSMPDENGNREIEGIMYDRLWIPLIPVINDLKARIEALEAKLGGIQ